MHVARRRPQRDHGLRSLAPGEPGYRARFEGPMPERDAAYHNGTVWPWLIGAYVEGVLRVPGPAGAAEARRAIAPLVDYLDARFLGMLPEVFDGDDTPDFPQRARACIARVEAASWPTIAFSRTPSSPRSIWPLTASSASP